MPQYPVSKPVLKAPPALHSPQEPNRALAGLAGIWPQPIKPLQRLQCKVWPCWENPLPPAPDGEMLFSIQWRKKNSRKTKRNINMKYARLPLCRREGEEDGSCWGRETSGAASGTAGRVWERQRGLSHLMAVMWSLLQPWKSSLPWLKPRKHLALDHRHAGWKAASGKHN